MWVSVYGKKETDVLNLQLAPVLAGFPAELASALVIIIIGVLSETSGVNAKSVLANLLGVFLMLITSGLDLIVLPLFVLYAIFGAVAFFHKWRQVYFFFSSKTYGSLMFAIALLHSQTAQASLQTVVQTAPQNLVSLSYLVIASTALVVLFWAPVGFFSYVAAWLLKLRRKK